MNKPLGGLSLLAFVFACAPAADPQSAEPDGLQLELQANRLEGRFVQDGMVVTFDADSDPGGAHATAHLDIGSIPLDVSLDVQNETLVEDAHDHAFDLDDRALLAALRDAIGAEHPEVVDSLHGRLLVKVADRFGEAPIGPALPRVAVALGQDPGKADEVQSGCGGDGVTCLPGTHGTSWAIFSNGSTCRAEQTPYGDSICRGRCGAGCSWFDEDYTWDCLDHDVCLDYQSDCSDEFLDAADDWAATVAPLCWSGTSRSRPPLVPVCGNGTVDVGEQCDDHNRSDGDGCSASCTIEQAPRELAAFEPPLSSVDEGAMEAVPTPELRVTLDGPAPAGGTQVLLSSADPSSLVVPESVTVPAGVTSAQVTVSAPHSAAAPVTVTATLRDRSLTAQVQVVHRPRLIALGPEGVTLQAGASGVFTVEIDASAEADVDVALSLVPGTAAQLGGPSVTVPAGERTATFEVLGLADGHETLVASLNGSEASVALSVTADVDIGGWQLVQTASRRTFTFPAGTLVGPGDTILVVRAADRAAFEAFWGVALPDGVITLNASAADNGGVEWPTLNGDETFELLDAAGQSIDGPTVALQALQCYQRTAPESGAGQIESWTVVAGSPGNATPGAAPGPSDAYAGLYVSEICDPTGPGNWAYEFVELHFD